MNEKLKENTESVKLESKNAKFDNAQSGKIESKRSSKNNDEVRLDSNGDEIVWEMKRSFHIGNKIYRVYFLIISIIVCSIITHAIFWTASPLNGFRGLFLILFVLATYYLFLSQILGLFNFKRLYITNNYLIIEKYIGKKAILQLGSFYAHSMRFSNFMSPKLTDNLCLTLFLENKEFVIDESNLYYADNAQNLIDKLNTLLKPRIVQYLLELDKEKYSQIHNDIFIKNEIPYFDEIDKLRKEKRRENGE